MSYQIHRKEGLEAAVRRIAASQLTEALREIDHPELDPDEKIHRVRKRCKKLRGLLRLVRPGLGGTYEKENAAFRDTARLLSGVRDARALLEAYDALLQHSDPRREREALANVRRRLALGLDQRADGEFEQLLSDARARLVAARQRVPGWKLKGKGFEPAARGLARTRARAERLAKEVAEVRDAEVRDAEVLHQWRKHVKDHGYHLRLLRRAWPEILDPWIRVLVELEERLGDHHDLTGLQRELHGSPDRFGSTRDREILEPLIAQRCEELGLAVSRLGQRVFAEPTDAFARRVRAYHTLWRTPRGDR